LTLNPEQKKMPLKGKVPLCGIKSQTVEGDKHKGERVKFTNSDPAMIRFMMNWFRDICNVPDKKLRIALHIHNLHITPRIEDYWSELARVPINQFQKTYVKRSSLRHRRNILYNGTCGIVIHDKNLFRRIMGWKLGLQGYFNISS